MAATKLGIYNKALGYLGERKLASLSEAREPRRVLDDYYSDVVQHCLEMGKWTFAIRKDEIGARPNRVPDFGFSHCFRKPDDWIRTIEISASETFHPPLLQYSEEGEFWEADCDPIYVKYLSKNNHFGFDLSRWSQLFEDYVVARLALEVCPRISGAESKIETLRRLERKALSAARGNDYANTAPQQQMGGSWVASRGGSGHGSRWDRQS